MREDFLHYLWRLARFDLRELYTTEGAPIIIHDFGIHNHDAGPDFSGAQLSIDGIRWAGQVEIHLQSSDWYVHGHEKDPAYDNVILHVVLEEDKAIYRANGERIPCLELGNRIPSGLINTYCRLVNNEYWIPCQNLLMKSSELVRKNWLDRLLIERLERRGQVFAEQLVACQRDWEEVFFRSVARSLGGKVNADAMEMLARSVPLRILLKHKHSLLQIEALLFGQSGLLPLDSQDDYPLLLRREYAILQQKYQLKPLPASVWRYLRLRPANFPTIRIAQLSRLLSTTGQLFSKALVAANHVELENMFTVKLSNYWRDHYRFEKAVNRQTRQLGTDSIRNILINTVAPLFYLYGQLRDNQAHQSAALTLLHTLPAEKNAVIRKWASLGWEATSAAESQSMLELRRHYCQQKKCMQCSIGSYLLKNGQNQPPRLTLNEQAQFYDYGAVL